MFLRFSSILRHGIVLMTIELPDQPADAAGVMPVVLPRSTCSEPYLPASCDDDAKIFISGQGGILVSTGHDSATLIGPNGQSAP